ncbi:cytochrome c biogenesis protein ResB [Enemella evansiae]|uniref:cytochrome c biogenesis protein ResB n=1 Tax=Enemella evansiae TaxID=2016499 RepID=UPI0010E7D55D|nr:cytochrome c biogenesis protein ResB [Enemella evansiae]TDO85374.1 cytochrome c biogenesis protein [Enemella evansiae]
MAEREAGTLTPLEFLRFCWNQLTSMRTALTLLFVGALAAIPGGLLPQRPTSPLKVKAYLAENPQVGAIYDKLGFFDAYTSPWFSAIYLLLLVSLVGCIIPRIITYAKGVRAQPVVTPRNLTRLPASTTVTAAADPLDRAEEFLRSKKFRVRRDDADGSISAERGYLREFGNLVFHTSLVFVLLGIAIGVLFGYRGTSTVLVGSGFSNNLSQYDDIRSGAAFTDQDLPPFSVLIDDFRVLFETGPVNTGQPTEFTAKVRVVDSPNATPRDAVIQVNRPLDVRGAEVHLLGHGYAPKVTVRDGQGNVAWSGPVIFLPQDGMFNSQGVVKAPDARPERLAFEGWFVPTAPVDSAAPRSLFPDTYNPALYLNAWVGPPRAEDGVPENVYSLDKTGMTQLKQANGDLLRERLKPGETWTLPEGQGSISFDGYQRWVTLQVSSTPGMPLTLGSVMIGVAGLCLSLFIRPRRLWVRVRPDGTADVAGLDRADARTGLEDDVLALADAVEDDKTD